MHLQGPWIEAARILRINGDDIAISALVNDQRVITGSADRSARLGEVLRAEPGTSLRARSQEGFDGRATTLARTKLKGGHRDLGKKGRRPYGHGPRHGYRSLRRHWHCYRHRYQQSGW